MSSSTDFDIDTLHMNPGGGRHGAGEPSGGSTDPFGAAPFDPERIRRHKAKQEFTKQQQFIHQQEHLIKINTNATTNQSLNPGNSFHFWN